MLWVIYVPEIKLYYYYVLAVYPASLGRKGGREGEGGRERGKGRRERGRGWRVGRGREGRREGGRLGGREGGKGGRGGRGGRGGKGEREEWWEAELGRSTLNVLNYKYKYFPPQKYLSTSTFLFGEMYLSTFRVLSKCT